MARYWIYISLILYALSTTAQENVTHYVVEGRLTDGSYEAKLLRLILEASKAPNEVIDFQYNTLYDQAIPHSMRIAQFSNLKGNLVMWTVTSKDRETFLRPIRVPVFKGMFGYRYLVIRKEDSAKFATIKTQKQLATLVAGQGEQWPDTRILRANELPVVTGLYQDNLYKMLVAKRFDYFPRSVVEISAEMESIKTYDLVIEPNLLLQYPNPMYFFVHNTNTELAERIEKGWEIIINNGSFDKFFLGEPFIHSVVEKMAEKPRLIFHLNTPDLPEKTPLHDSRYWLDLSKFHTSQKSAADHH